MESLQARLKAFQESGAGLFIKKALDDQATNLAALLAWGTLSTLLPLVLGVLAILGLVLRDPARLDTAYATLLSVMPGAATSGLLDSALKGVRTQAAAPVGIVGLLLLLYNGSSFFSNMASVFDQAYHVEDRNPVLRILVSVFMLLFVGGLLMLSTVALGIGAVVDNLPFALPVGPGLSRIVSWLISLASAIVVFLVLYRVLPNKKQSWRNTLPGALLATVLFFLILAVFPLYTAFFPPNQAYAALGIFLVFTFFLYLLGMVLVLGAELNAFLEAPRKSVALAEAQANANAGRASVMEAGGSVEAQAKGSAPNGKVPAGVLGVRSRDTADGDGQRLPAGESGSVGGVTLAGKVLGLGALLAAVVLVRGERPHDT